MSGEPARTERVGADAVRWRRVLLAFCAVGFLCWGFNVFPEGWLGGAGFVSAPTAVVFRDSVLATLPGLAAAKAGLRVNDVFLLRDASPADRWRVRAHVFVNGQSYTYAIQRGATQRRITIRPGRNPDVYDFSAWSSFLGSLGALVFATLIAWRRPERVEARVLCLLLVANVAWGCLDPHSAPTPSAAIDFARDILSLVVHELSLLLLIFYTLLFGRPVSRMRKVVAGVALAIVGFDLLSTLAGYVGNWSGAFDVEGGPIGSLAIWNWASIAWLLIPVVVMATAVGAARDRERSLLLWTTATTFLSGALPFVGFAFAFIPHLDTQRFSEFMRLLGGVCEFLTPFTIGYAILNRRLLDIGFVITRGTSIALISAAAIAIFATLEWSLGAFYSGLGRSAVLAMNVVAAIGFGLLAPALYRWIASLVERYLFRRQFVARERVGRLAAGLPFAESTAAIAETLTHGVCSDLSMPSGAVFRRENNDKPFVRESAVGWSAGEQLEAIDAERLAMALQAARSMLRITDQHLSGQTLPRNECAPAVAYPLFARQEFIGFVLYSIHPGGVDLDPDERALLAEVAQQASRGYDSVELAQRVGRSYEARVEAEAEARDTLQRSNAALERLNEAYYRFVPEDFLRHLNKRSIVDVALGDSVLQRMTVLFSDMRSFTKLSESMSPPATFKFINDYLYRVGPLIREHDGFIDKYIGDAIMALFPGKPDDALDAAIALQQEIRIHNRQLEREIQPAVAAGVGIHTGELMLGTIGERGRMETTVIADTVNVAAHIESTTKLLGCSILLTRDAKEALADPDRFMLRRLGMVQLKSKSQKVEVFECFGGDPADVIEHKANTALRFASALEAFEAGAMSDAVKRFTPIAQNCSADRPAAYYLSRSLDPGPHQTN